MPIILFVCYYACAVVSLTFRENMKNGGEQFCCQSAASVWYGWRYVYYSGRDIYHCMILDNVYRICFNCQDMMITNHKTWHRPSAEQRVDLFNHLHLLLECCGCIKCVTWLTKVTDIFNHLFLIRYTNSSCWGPRRS